MFLSNMTRGQKRPKVITACDLSLQLSNPSFGSREKSFNRHQKSADAVNTVFENQPKNIAFSKLFNSHLVTLFNRKLLSTMLWFMRVFNGFSTTVSQVKVAWKSKECHEARLLLQERAYPSKVTKENNMHICSKHNKPSLGC